jgi:hypothetical protein
LKNKWTNQKIEKYTSTAKPHGGKFVSHGGSIPAVIPHVVKSLPPWGTVAGEHLWRQGRAAWRQDPAAQRHGDSPLPPCHVAVSPFLFYLIFHFKTLLIFKKQADKCNHNHKIIS